MKAKGLAWVGIGTDHYSATRRLFADVFGMEVMAEGDEQVILRMPSGQQVELFGAEGRGKSLNSPPTVAFEVDDIAEARDALVAAGIEIVGEAGSWNGHEWLYFRSPDGYLFEVKKTPPDG